MVRSHHAHDGGLDRDRHEALGARRAVQARAVELGSKDIFVNILTSQGLVQRYVTDSLGSEVEIESIAIRLGAPAHPGDTLTFTGERDGNRVQVTGTVSLGAHVTGTVTLR